MPIPARNLQCPICGAPNQCAAADAASFDTPCWCTSVTISAETLARIPPGQRELSCICPRCARGNGLPETRFRLR